MPVTPEEMDQKDELTLALEEHGAAPGTLIKDQEAARKKIVETILALPEEVKVNEVVALTRELDRLTDSQATWRGWQARDIGQDQGRRFVNINFNGLQPGGDPDSSTPDPLAAVEDKGHE